MFWFLFLFSASAYHQPCDKVLKDNLRTVIQRLPAGVHVSEIIREYQNEPEGERKIKLRNQVVEHAYFFMMRLANEFQLKGNFDFWDRAQAGVFGILKAIDRFDPQGGYSFFASLRFHIKDEIRKLAVEQPYESGNEEYEEVFRALSRKDEKNEWIQKEYQEFYLRKIREKIELLREPVRHVITRFYGLDGRPTQTLEEIGGGREKRGAAHRLKLEGIRTLQTLMSQKISQEEMALLQLIFENKGRVPSEDKKQLETLLEKIRESLPQLREPVREVLSRLYGLDGGPPQTLGEMAQEGKYSRRMIYHHRKEGILHLQALLFEKVSKGEKALLQAVYKGTGIEPVEPEQVEVALNKIKEKVKLLPEEVQGVIVQHYGLTGNLPMTLDEIADGKRSKSAVFQNKKRGVETLRKWLGISPEEVDS